MGTKLKSSISSIDQKSTAVKFIVGVIDAEFNKHGRHKSGSSSPVLIYIYMTEAFDMIVWSSHTIVLNNCKEQISISMIKGSIYQL